MRKTATVLLGVLAVLAGLYVGFYLMFIGGIVQIVDAVQEEPADSFGIAWGVVRVVFAGVVGSLTAYAVGFLAFMVGKDA